MNSQLNFKQFECIVEENNKINGNYIQQGEPTIEILDTINGIENKYPYLFFGRSYDDTLWITGSDLEVLCYFARKEMLRLEQSKKTLNSSVDYSLIRKRICELCHASRAIILSTEYSEVKAHMLPSIKMLLRDIKRLTDLTDDILFNYNYISPKASYNYLHLLLDMYWFKLMSEHCLEEDLSNKLEVFEKNLHTTLLDLIYTSIKKFKNDKYLDITNLCTYSPFLCSCFKELWLLIQLYVDKLKDQQFCKDFWYYFNKALTSTINLQNCCAKDIVVCLWLLYHVAIIQGYNSNGDYIGSKHYRVMSNYSLIEQCLKSIINNSNEIEEKIKCTCLHFFALLQINWWTKDAGYYLLQLLWEYFYKKLNTSFCTSNNPTNRNCAFNTENSHDYCFITETILYFDFESPSNNSYNIFLCVLGKYLTLNPIHWPKLKGRIYSKLSPPKLAELSETGLHNLVKLFFVLAATVNFDELANKLQSLLSSLPAARYEYSSAIWSAQISLLIMRIKRGLTLNSAGGNEICTPILQAVVNASGNRNQEHVMRIYIEGIEKLLNESRDLNNQEHILFDGWIDRYMQWCSHTDACYLINILKKIIKRIKNSNQLQWWTVFENNVVPTIIHLTTNSNTLSQITELAVALVVTDSNRFKNIIQHMCSDNIDVSLNIKFLKLLLEKITDIEKITINQNLILQVWIRIAILSTNKSELIEITFLICKLLKCLSNFGLEDSSDEDPLYKMIRSAGLRIRDAKSVQETTEVKQWFETYFGRLDHWIKPLIATDNAQLIMRIYTAVALLFLHCSPGLYVKNKNTCIFYRLTSTLLLPSTILMNKKPPSSILLSMKRTWHIFVRGIARLDYNKDPYIERVLKDMVIKYVPHLNEGSSPIARCLDSEFDKSATKFILNKIANTFITCKSKNAHEHSLSALKLALEMSQLKNDNLEKITMFASITLPSLFEQYTFSENSVVKNIVNEIIENLKTSNFYSQLRKIFQNSILTLVDKHLAFYSTNVFRFFESVGCLLQSEIEEILPKLNEAIVVVESMRGVAYDNNLRRGLQQIRNSVNK